VQLITPVGPVVKVAHDIACQLLLDVAVTGEQDATPVGPVLLLAQVVVTKLGGVALDAVQV
jgi:hypothetical protein